MALLASSIPNRSRTEVLCASSMMIARHRLDDEGFEAALAGITGHKACQSSTHQVNNLLIH
jgi:hypothetical protein